VHATEQQLAEHGDKVDGALKAEIEAAIAEVKTALEGGDNADISAKTQALTEKAMKLGQAIYEKEQAAAAAPGGAGGQAHDDGVVDAEFSEVDENKG
jgi:molecular chaperone DnaK